MKKLIQSTLVLLFILTFSQIAFANGWLDSLLSNIPGVPDLTPPPEESGFAWFYAKSIAITTWVIGWLRNLFPKFKGEGIPRAIQITIVGVAAGIFIIWKGGDNINWLELIGSVLGTQIIYDKVSDLIKDVEGKSPVLGAALNWLLRGKFPAGFKIQVTPPNPSILAIPLIALSASLFAQTSDQAYILGPDSPIMLPLSQTILETTDDVDIFYGIPQKTIDGFWDYSDLDDLTHEKDLSKGTKVFLLACGMKSEYAPVSFELDGFVYEGVYIKSDKLKLVRGHLGKMVSANKLPVR